MKNCINPYVQYMYSYPHKTAYGSLEGLRFDEVAAQLASHETGLYFHIPFCESKCGYCNLFSVTGQSEKVMERYVDAMERHAGQLAGCLPEKMSFSDLTVGGGTPLILPAKQLERVFRIAAELLRFQEREHPVIVETSPGQTTEEKLYLLKEHHVTRISMGVQSFCEQELQTLCRKHTAEQVERAMECIRKVGFPCVNLDLIYGVPGQTTDTLLESADRALAYEPEELFVYPLYIKKGTYLYGKSVKRPQDTYEMYLRLRAYLKKQGYVPYSMRRFVREKSGDGAPGRDAASSMSRECLKSCGFENTISIGCGGRSYIGNLHFCSPYEVRQSACRERLEQYMEQEDFLPITHGYRLSEDEQRRRYVIKNILFCCGLSLDEYRELFSGQAEEDFPMLCDWVKEGYAREQSGRIVLTENGAALSDYLGPMLISDEVWEKMRHSTVSPV